VAAREAAARMNAWTRVDLLLGGLAAVLLALHLWPQAASQGTGPGGTLTGLSPDAVGKIRVERGDRLVLALERDGDDWRLVYPEAGPAQPRRVQQLLAIARAPVQGRFPAGDDLARYGLEAPGAVLQLDGARLAFGDRDPSQQLRYVLADGEVRVIDDVYFNLLTLPARHFGGD
jgi:hypothetical protein